MSLEQKVVLKLCVKHALSIMGVLLQLWSLLLMQHMKIMAKQKNYALHMALTSLGWRQMRLIVWLYLVVKIQIKKMPTLSGFWRRALVEQVENEIASSKELENVVILENLMDSMKGHKSTVKERGLDKILQAGCGTAAYTTTRLLELLDVSLKSDGYAAAARVAIIRQSTGPLIKAASMSVNDIDTLVDSHMELFLRSNFNRDTGAFPPIFKMINHNRAHFSDEFNSSIDRLTKYTTADERPVIGCPILLNRGQAVKLWEWGLEMGVKAGFLGRD